MRRLAIVLVAVTLASSACDAVAENREPWCRAVPATQLLARSVPSAALVPCVRELPSGWTFAGFTASDTGSTFALAGPDEAAGRLDVTFQEACRDVDGRRIPSDERGAELSEEVLDADPFAAVWTYRFDGGCTRASVTLGADPLPGITARDLGDALSFLPAPAVDGPADPGDA